MEKMTVSQKVDHYEAMAERYGARKVIEFLVSCIAEEIKPDPEELR